MASKSRLMSFFKRGIRALLPTVLTLGVILFVYNFFDMNVVEPVNDGIETFLVRTAPGRTVMDAVFDLRVDDYRVDGDDIDYDRLRGDLDEVYPPIIGIVVAVALIFIAGSILATFVGRRILGRFESAMGRFPVVKIIYPYARQVVEFFMREKTVTFHSVVAIEYPRRGLYSIGFVTGLGFKEINRAAKGTLINIFLPSCPTPVTGYVIFVPVEDLVPLPISVDEAIRFAISGGVLVPASQQNPEGILQRFENLAPPSVEDKPDEEE